ncbi:DUF4421 family protein [Flavobacterium sp. DG1-102-2]|uniref:DUF4421 family protein n=1 Tax=Flavobacterium sp. DG1-102-2 TaxID=3081663 RepID=UPI002949E32E|nr:DUF4421 family protein [Flavobacterium sp. DG1-102-2]MDV6168591.1 DUF4421 family protein [Flavobacterium sp. DG1-102-2]
MILRFYFLLITIAVSQNSSGQSVDTTYIGQYPQKMMVKAFVSRNGIVIGHNDKDYSPNNPVRLGFGFSLKNTVVNLSSSFGIFPAEKDYGDTKSVDFQIHNYGKKILVDLYYQKYKGFYNDNGNVTLYPSTSAQMIGGELTYVFNHKRFSTKAALEQTEKQLQSAGSFLLGGGAYHYRIRLEEAFGAGNSSVNNFQLGVNAGYGYSWVINEHWLLSGMATVGVNAGNEVDVLEDGKIKLYPTAFARGGAGYHKNDWGIGMSFLVNNKLLYYTTDSFSLTSVNLQITYIKHFDSVFKRK